MNADRFLQANVVDRQNVRAKLVKDQEHFRSPAPDALDVGQCGDQRFVVEGGPYGRIELSRDEVPRQIPHIFALALRKTHPPQRALLRPTYAAWIESDGASAAVRREDQSFPNRLRSLHRDLLADDRPRQRGESVTAADEMDVREMADQPAQNAISRGESGRGFVPVRRFHWRGLKAI